MAQDIRMMIKQAPMSRFQFSAVAVCVLANISDGFDIISMSFVAPFLKDDWGLSSQQLGLIFSSAGLGLFIGALLAMSADRIGRRPVVLGALATIATAMIGCALTESLSVLMILRFFVGVGIGAVTPNLNVLVMEYSNEKWVNRLLSFLHVGLAIASVFCSTLAILLISPYGWQSLFWVAAGLSGLTLTLGYFLLPESPEFLAASRRPGALPALNRVFVRMGRPPVLELPPAAPRKPGFRLPAFHIGFVAAVLLFGVGAFAHFFAHYFHKAWTPQILISAGLSSTVALSSGAVMGVSGALGSIFAGWSANALGLKRLSVLVFALSGVSMLALGMLPALPLPMLVAAGLVSFFLMAAYMCVCLGALAHFPVMSRTSGLGLAILMGRLGAIFGPFAGGLLIDWGWERPSYYPIFAIVCGIGAVAMLFAPVANKVEHAEAGVGAPTPKRATAH